jgi:hypothetical protein
MNPTTAQNELRKPPKIEFQSLVFEAVGMLTTAVVLVGLFT